jgi:hypothetical protein
MEVHFYPASAIPPTPVCIHVHLLTKSQYYYAYAVNWFTTGLV